MSGLNLLPFVFTLLCIYAPVYVFPCVFTPLCIYAPLYLRPCLCVPLCIYAAVYLRPCVSTPLFMCSPVYLPLSSFAPDSIHVWPRFFFPWSMVITPVNISKTYDFVVIKILRHFPSKTSWGRGHHIIRLGAITVKLARLCMGLDSGRKLTLKRRFSITLYHLSYSLQHRHSTWISRLDFKLLKFGNSDYSLSK